MEVYTDTSSAGGRTVRKGLGGTVSDLLPFLREFVRDPRGVASIAPSGRALASLITKELSFRTGPVIELGPGTGAITQAVIARGVRERDLTLVEYGSDFARLLQMRFPQARVLWMDAAALDRHVLFPDLSVGAVVCGLGLLNMDERKVAAILHGAFRYLRPDGAFFLYTYGKRCSVPEPLLDALGLQATRIGRTIRNIPPATVYRLSRRPVAG